MSNILKEIDINITRDNSISSKISQKINTANNHNKIINNNKSTNITVYKEDELLGMLYKDVVKVARSCGVKYNGKKVEIAKRIIQHQREQIIINKLNKINLNSNNNNNNENNVCNNININNSNPVGYEEEEEILNTSLNNNYNGSSEEEDDELESYQIETNHIDSNSEDENEAQDDSQDEHSQSEAQDDTNVGSEDEIENDHENSSVCNQSLLNLKNGSPLLEATPSYKIQITKSIMSVEKDSNGKLLVINRYDSDDEESAQDSEESDQYSEESAQDSEESAQDSEESAQDSDEESIDESNSTIYSTADEEDNDSDRD